jgi:peptidoglycan/xylan/chitin deacetylase (PgdA/CDA1 family)
MVTRLAGNDWAVAQGEPPQRLMSPAQVREMAAYGVEFGGHTRTHVNFDLVSGEVARAEIAGCKADLEEWLGVPAVSFAYPYGAIHPHVKQLVKDAGFRFGIATKSGPARLGEDPLQVRRINVSYRTGMPTFRMKVSGHYHEPLRGLGHALWPGR